MQGETLKFVKTTMFWSAASICGYCQDVGNRFL